VVLHVLPAGSRFDLTRRTLVRQPPAIDESEADEIAEAGSDLRRLARDIAAADASPTALRRRQARSRKQTAPRRNGDSE
jgi:cyanophycinase